MPYVYGLAGDRPLPIDYVKARKPNISVKIRPSNAKGIELCPKIK